MLRTWEYTAPADVKCQMSSVLNCGDGEWWWSGAQKRDKSEGRQARCGTEIGIVGLECIRVLKMHLEAARHFMLAHPEPRLPNSHHLLGKPSPLLINVDPVHWNVRIKDISEGKPYPMDPPPNLKTSPQGKKIEKLTSFLNEIGERKIHQHYPMDPPTPPRKKII